MRQCYTKRGKIYADKLDARIYLHVDRSLFKTTQEIYLEHKRFLPYLSYTVEPQSLAHIWTTEICSKYGKLESLRVNHSARVGDI